jgi:SAM-dependent methyltransferase
MSTTYFTASPEQAARARCKATWEAGDFSLVAKFNEPVAEEFLLRLPLKPGARILDLACGTGNLAVPAARAGCCASGVDIAGNLIAKARSRAQAENLNIEFTEADAQELPYPNGEFDFVVSMFGVMFAPKPECALAELVRVCKPGGMIALANWTQESFIGENFRVVGRHVPPLAGGISPLLWGDEETVRARFGHAVRDLKLTRRIARLRYPFPPAQTVDFFRQFYGPTVRAFGALNCEGQARLHADLEEMFVRHNQADGGATEVHAEYLEVIATR